MEKKQLFSIHCNHFKRREKNKPRRRVCSNGLCLTRPCSLKVCREKAQSVRRAEKHFSRKLLDKLVAFEQKILNFVKEEKRVALIIGLARITKNMERISTSIGQRERLRSTRNSFNENEIKLSCFQKGQRNLLFVGWNVMNRNCLV